MRFFPLLILVMCGLSVALAPKRLVANDLPIAATEADDAAGQTQYEVLQAQADLALDLLRQAHERRLAATQFATN